MSETTTNRTNQSATTATLAGYEIPRLGMGTMALAIEGRPSNRNQAIETIHAALDAGVRYLDTAWSYYLPSAPGTGEPEDMGYGEYLVRDALHSWHGPKDQVLVATKTGWLRTLDGNGNYGWQADARPETMIANAKESARRLGVDTLDLLYSHCNDPQVPYEDQMGALKQLVDEGVAKAVGISRIDNADIETARNILGDRLVAVQHQFSPVPATLNTRWKPAKSSVWLLSAGRHSADSSTRSTSICSTGSAKSPRFTTAPTSASRSRGNLRNTNICSRFPRPETRRRFRTRSKPAN